MIVLINLFIYSFEEGRKRGRRGGDKTGVKMKAIRGSPERGRNEREVKSK